MSTPDIESKSPQPASPTVGGMDIFGSEEEYLRSQALGLAPMDRGVKAWTFVACACTLEGIVFGFAYSFGVFQEYYLRTAPFNESSESAINSIGTVCNALQYVLMPFIIAFVHRRPQWVRPMEWISLAVSVGALVVSSFTTTVWHLIILQGVLVGTGGAMLYAPVVVSLNQWFVERRSLATAIIFAGSGAGGAVFPVLINLLLTKVGFAWTLRILGAVVAVCGGIALLGAVPRLPVAPVSNPNAASLASASLMSMFSFVRNPLFISLGLTIMVQALAFFPVSLYIPSYASSIGLSTLSGTIALAVFNITGVIAFFAFPTDLGQVLFGYICDRTAYTRVMFASALGSALAAYFLWGWAHNIGLLLTFVIVFGSLSVGFSSIIAPASMDITGPGAQSALLMGCLDIFKGVAIIVGPLISAALRRQHVDSHPALDPNSLAGGYAGYGFTGITLFVGSMMSVTTVASLITSWLRTKTPVHIRH